MPLIDTRAKEVAIAGLFILAVAILAVGILATVAIFKWSSEAAVPGNPSTAVAATRSAEEQRLNAKKQSRAAEEDRLKAKQKHSKNGRFKIPL
jgi:uncharacterized protein (DUF58 family)